MGEPGQARTPSLATVLALLMGCAGVVIVAHSQAPNLSQTPNTKASGEPAYRAPQAPGRARATPQPGAAPQQARPRGVSWDRAWQDEFADCARRLEGFDFEAFRRAVRDLAAGFPTQYIKGDEFLRRADALEKRRPDILAALKKRQYAALDEADSVFALQREALLANPLLDFDELLVVRRKPLGGTRLLMSEAQPYGIGEFLGLPRQSSMQLNAIQGLFGWENDIAVLSSLRGEPVMRTLFRPDKRRLLSAVRLNWDADRFLFSMPDDRELWQVWEMGSDGKGLRRITGDQPDVHSFDAVYLPNGKINFVSTAVFQGVPCNPNIAVGQMYQMDRDGKNIRQICFDQDHNYNPTVMNDGRVMYLRWRNMGDTLQLVSRYLCDVLRAESLAIFTLETDAAAGAPRRLRGSAVTGSFPTFQKSSDLVMSKAKHRLEHLKHEYIAVGEGIIGRAAQENRSILVSDTTGYANPDEIPRRVYTLMAVPVQVDGRFVGVACAVNCREEGRRFDEQDLRLFENLSYQAALASKLVAIYAERGKHERLQRELQVGQEIQRSLLPATVPQWNEYRFAAFAQPALEVGGDYYDFVSIDADRLMVVMADASGKGVPACMLMAACRSFVHCLADRYTGLPQFLQELNSRLYRSTDHAHFLTMAVAVLDRRSHVLEYGNAGHTPLLVRGPDGVTRSLKPEGPALGMLPDDLCPQFETVSLDVPAGARLLLFTDGITEALNAADAEFGLDRLRQVWEKGNADPQGLADLVITAVRQFCGATRQYDDQTMVVIARE